MEEGIVEGVAGVQEFRSPPRCRWIDDSLSLTGTFSLAIS
jgi:hypothetical protein